MPSLAKFSVFCAAMFFTAAARAQPSEPLRIASGPLALEFNAGQGRFTITDGRTGRRWDSLPSEGLRIISARPAGPSQLAIVLRDSSSQAEFSASIAVLPNGRVVFDLDARDRTAEFETLEFPPALATAFRDGELTFCNRSCGVLIAQNDKDFPAKVLPSYANLGLDMPWAGVVDGKKGDGMMVLIETPADAAVILRPDSRERYWLQPRWSAAMQRWAYPRRVSYRFSPTGGYVALAKMYRTYARENGLLKTLAEKAADRPKVAWLKGAAVVWGSEGLKFAREARAAGVRRGIIYGPDDGPSPAAEDIQAMTGLGFLVSEIDNLYECEEGETGYGHDRMEEAGIRTAEGKPFAGWDGQGFVRSPSLGLRAARAYMPSLLEQHPFTARFLDESPTTDLLEDYHPNHRLDRRQDIAYRVELFRYFSKELGLVLAGEHGKAWNVPFLDYTEGMMSGPFWWKEGNKPGHLVVPRDRAYMPPDFAKYDSYTVRIPLWELVFHDCLATTWYWGDSSGWFYATQPDVSDRKDLSNILYGTMPLLWADKKGYGWNRNRARFLETVRNVCNFHERVAFEEMLTHEYLSEDRAVQRTRFSGGGVAVVNYGNEPRTYKDGERTLLLAPLGFYASAPGFRQSRTIEQGNVITRIEAKGLLSVESKARRRIGPVELQGRLTVFEATPGRWHLLAETQGESSVDMRKLTGQAKRCSLVELADDGAPERDVAPDVPGCKVMLPAGSGIRLFEVRTVF